MINSPYMKWEPGKDRSTLLITFAAISGPSGSPAFAFANVAKDLQCSKLFFVDPNDCIYQLGIPGIGSDFWEITDAIKRLQQWEGIKQTIILGNSAGGFAALVVGALLGNCTVHVFNPPTLLTSPQHSHQPLLCRRVFRANTRNKRTFNLAAFLREETTATTTSYVYYSHGDGIDRRRSQFLKNIQQVHVVPFNLPGHELARYAAREGAITRLLHASLNSDHKLIRTIIQRARRKACIQLMGNLGQWIMNKAKRKALPLRLLEKAA